MKRPLTRSLLLLALACIGLVVYRSDRLLFEIPAARAERYFSKVGHALATHHGLSFLMTFDEPRPQEWVGRGAIRYPGTERVPGRIGQARRFDGRTSTHVATSALWQNLGSNYTLSLWVNLESTGMDQDIWYTFMQAQQTGFKLLDGRLTFFVPGRPEQAASYPFESFGRFVHLAGVVDGINGEARLYENGEWKATVPVAEVLHPAHNMEFGKTRWYAATAPLRGTLDEAAAWNRSLSPKEIRALARARLPLPLRLEPFPWARWQAVRTGQAVLPAALRMLDRFNPFLHEGRAAAADLPDLALQFSSSDARHFIHAHESSLASGRRTRRGANPRRIHAQYQGRTVEARAWLDGSDTGYPSSRRPAYVLETPEDTPAFGARWLRLTPPETMGSRLPRIAGAAARTGSSNEPGGLCRLTINGLPKGIYHVESFDRFGLAPGERTDVADGSKSQIDWSSLFRTSPPDDPPVPSPLPGEARQAQLDPARHLLVNDIFHPWSSREWAWRIRTCRTSTAPSRTGRLSPYAVLGRNPSPAFVIDDLDLQAGEASAGDVAWHSSNPDRIDEAGHVSRPAGDLPVDVVLTATLREDGRTETVPLLFRVMPRDRRLPALMLSARDPLNSIQRVDFQALYYPAHEEGPPRRLLGGQATGGGIKHRGNTSYWRSQKKPFSLRFDVPHRLLGTSRSCHLYLLNGYVDSTKLRNKLAYDLFRSFGGPDRPRPAPEMDWTEVFINGRYAGIYEMCTRVDEQMLGFEEDPAQAALPVLYKIRPDPYWFATRRTDAFDPVFPRKRRIVEPLMDLTEFTSQADPGQFARDIDRWLDVDNAIDFFLLLNFSGNADGRTTNFFLARDGAPGARFIFIPWDYDHTFPGQTRWLTNELLDRLLKDVPGFRTRMGRRWQELRKGPLADAALESRIDGMARHLAGYMDGESAFLQGPATPAYPDRVAQLKQSARAHAASLDARFAKTPPP